MHKARYNALRLKLRLSPRGPLLIKAGGISANPTLPDMQFVRTFHPEKGEAPYVPGSSFKGVVRGFVEKALRTLDASNQPGPSLAKQWKWACATFEAKQEEHHDKNKWNCPQFLTSKDKELFSYEIYANSCGACRIFGHTRLKGRAAFTDLLPTADVKTEIRYGVAISRLSHAVGAGPFEMEIAVAGTFEGHLILENFELWQLGLLALALEGMNQGLVKVGFGKNRGFGEVQVEVTEAALEELASGAQDTVWRGMGAFISDQEAQSYRLFEPYRIEGMPTPERSEAVGFYVRRMYGPETWRQAARSVMEQTLSAT